ncbi:hypothetical protein FF38_00551 [Lucilia cuprina]|uniref:Uncharacterized protein n=1 Tax=Lucilia cuprina TaxID=7375 RepID=A0A0L0CKM7_LUCCU|nr:hypothetical protein FF38_00551 [Lucilia cuprina]
MTIMGEKHEVNIRTDNKQVGIQLAPMGAWCGSEEKLRVRDGIVVKVNNANGRQISRIVPITISFTFKNLNH